MERRCVECETNFSTISNLRKHVRQFHSKDVSKLAPLRNRKSSPDSNIRCSVCKKTFNHRQSLQKHVKLHGVSDKPQTKVIKNPKKCPLCDYSAPLRKNFENHYQNVHDISLHWSNLTFSCIEDFNQWKMQIETKTFSKFIKKSKELFLSHTTIYYACHRSGNYIQKGKGKRRLKTKGSNKINGYCPAHIQLSMENNGNLKVKFLETHVGHTLDIDHLQLTDSERKSIAAKIAAKVSFDDILKEIRNSVTDDNPKRIHLITKKDLFNIGSALNSSTSSVRHFANVESSVTEMRQDASNDASPREVDKSPVDCNENENEKSDAFIIEWTKKPKSNRSVEDRRKNILLQFQVILACADSHQKLDAVDKVIDSLLPTFDAIDCNNGDKCAVPPLHYY